MAEAEQPNIPMAVLTQNFRELQYELQIAGLSSQVKQFTGEGGRNLRAWMRDMTKVGLTLGNDQEKMKVLALQTLKGPAADFYSRLLRQRPQATWAEILQALKSRFSDQTDEQFAQQRLKRLKQNTGESAQNFAERIVDIAEEAFGTIDLSAPLIQQQLKDVFLDGFRDDQIARRIIRQHPNSLDSALQIAVQEQLTNRTFDLRQKEEPMEVDMASGTNNNMGELKTMLTEVLSLARQGPPQNPQTNTQNEPRTYKGKPLQWTRDGKVVCAHCSKIGHRWRQCFKRKQEEEQKKDQGNWKPLVQ